MSKLTTLFWDIGGVILSNGWDEAITERAARVFQFDLGDFQVRHRISFPDYEKGEMTLDAYLDHAIFYRARDFTKSQLVEFMFAQSTEMLDSRVVLDELSAAGDHFMATLNNEGMELNRYRIQEFDLQRNFSAFLTSCFLGVRKPDVAMYERALGITQCVPEECLFIDDRISNIEGARRAGLRCIHFQSAPQLRAELVQHGVMPARQVRG